MGSSNITILPFLTTVHYTLLENLTVQSKIMSELSSEQVLPVNSLVNDTDNMLMNAVAGSGKVLLQITYYTYAQIIYYYTYASIQSHPSSKLLTPIPYVLFV